MKSLFYFWVESLEFELSCVQFGHLAAISDAIYNLMAGNELSTSQLASVDIVDNIRIQIKCHTQRTEILVGRWMLYYIQLLKKCFYLILLSTTFFKRSTISVYLFSSFNATKSLKESEWIQNGIMRMIRLRLNQTSEYPPPQWKFYR